MPEPPTISHDNEQFMPCPCCTMQIPVGTRICPHCRLEVPESIRKEAEKAAVKSILKKQRDDEPLSASGLWASYGKWAVAAGPVLIALVILYLVYGRWSEHRISITPNAQLPVTVAQEKKDDTVRIKVTVKNEGDDVPDLSLKSIGVVLEIHRKDGGVEKKTVFPKSDYRGEGALLRGESGSFDLDLPAKGIREIFLRSEIVDLGAGREMIPAAEKSR